MRGYKATAESATPRAVRRSAAELRPGRALGCARRSRVHLGGGHQLRAGVPPSARPRRPADSVLGHRVGVRREAHRPRRSATSSPPARSSPTRTATPWPTMRFRILRFRPAATGQDGQARPWPARPWPGTRCGPVRAHRRTTPSSSRAPKRGTLLIQRCASCGMLRHPPRPACAVCGSFEWDTVTVERTGHGLQLRGRPPPPGPRLRLPAAHRRGRARGGHAPGGRPRRAWTLTTSRIGMPVARRDGGRRRRAHPADVPARRRADEGTPMDFAFTEEQQAVAEAAAGRLRRHGHPDTGGGDRAHRRPRRRRAVGRAGQGQPPRPGRPRGARRVGARAHRAVPRARAAGPRRGAGSRCGPPSCSAPAPQPASAPPNQQARWLPGVAAGTSVSSAALTEVAASTDRVGPAVARRGQGRRVRPWTA